MNKTPKINTSNLTASDVDRLDNQVLKRIISRHQQAKLNTENITVSHVRTGSVQLTE